MIARTLFILLSILHTLLLSAQSDFDLSVISSYHTGTFDEGAAEIVAYDKITQRVFFTNADANTIGILDVADPKNPTLYKEIDLSPYGGGINSVAVNGNRIVAAVQADVKQDAGKLVFFNTDGEYLAEAPAGALPDMVTFSPDGMYVLAANEGEPNDDYTVDPEGSVTIVLLTNGMDDLRTAQVTFEQYNDQKTSLLNKGIWIYGPNATVAQDLEPEYITVVGTKAYVSLQENNALAVIDIPTAEILDIYPLGYKDHSKGRPTLQSYLVNEAAGWPELGTPLTEGADPVLLGGFSGLYFDQGESTDDQYVFYTIPDRGPNEANIKKADVTPATPQNIRPFMLPDYQARIVKFTLDRNTGVITLGDPIYLTAKDGTTPISGKGNIPGVDEVPVTRTVAGSAYDQVDYIGPDSTEYHALPYDRFGGDFEGIVKDKRGYIWMCDEYRPGIFKFSSTGQLLERYVAEGTAQLGTEPKEAGYYGAETLPAIYAKRRANRGFEAIAYDKDNDIIYAFIQSPMYNPSSTTKDNSDAIRIIGISATTGEAVSEYIYLLERNRLAGSALGRVDKIGDAIYIGAGRFLVLERDSSKPGQKTGKKYVYEINLKGATNMLGDVVSTENGADGTLTIEQMTPDQILAAGISAVHKRKVLNLPSIGYEGSDKAEGLVVLPNGDLAVMNDNDFGLAGAGITDDCELGIISFGSDYGIDASNKSDDISIQNWPILGAYMPDAITSVEIDGAAYVLTANEGDSRDYDGYSEEERVKDLTLDPMVYPDAATMQEDDQLGRLKTTTAQGDLDGDGDVDQIYSYGTRSFSIWDEYGNLVWDSGDDFEQRLAEIEPDNFNSTNDENDSRKNRSDDKGPEPEAIEIAHLDDKVYALIGLERQGGIMVYDITNPSAPGFVSYFNNRDFSVEDATSEAIGDLGTEDVVYVSAEDSPTGSPMVITANEVSGTVTFLGVNDTMETEPTSGQITVTSYFKDGNPYNIKGNPVSLYVRRPAGYEPIKEILRNIKDGDVIDLPARTEWALHYADNTIELANGAIYKRTGYFTRGVVRGDYIREIGEGAIIFVYSLVTPAETPELPTNDGSMATLIGHHSTGLFDDSAAEIVAHDPSTQVLIYTNGAANKLEVLDIASPANPTLSQSIDMSMYGSDHTSVAIHDGIVAVAVVGETKQDTGSVVFFNAEGEFIRQIPAGALPDMVTFSPDGRYVLVANEGEPNDDYTIDPEGTVTIIDMQDGVAAATSRTITFDTYNDQKSVLMDKGIRIYGPGASVAQDLEPEYIAVTPDSKYAFVSLQENNAMAKINITTGEIIDLFSLGLKDHRMVGNGLDPSNKTDDIEIATWPVFGMYQPDAIRTYAVGGKTYVLTANEGDSRDYDGYSEEERVKDLTLDASAYPNATDLQTDDAIGRMKTTTASGDTDGDGDIDLIHVYGGRSFSIWTDDCKLIWDSGDMIEQKIAELAPDVFNSNNDDNDSRKSRSDDKGPEPEAIEVMPYGDKFYALVGLERQGGVMTFDITDPTSVSYVGYFNNRNFDVAADDPKAGDLGIEDIKYIASADSPNGHPLLVTANEVSGTISIFEMKSPVLTEAEPIATARSIEEVTIETSSIIYPNPTMDMLHISYRLDADADVSVDIISAAGQMIMSVASPNGQKGRHEIKRNVSKLIPGIYHVRIDINGKTEVHSFVKE